MTIWKEEAGQIFISIILETEMTLFITMTPAKRE